MKHLKRFTVDSDARITVTPYSDMVRPSIDDHLTEVIKMFASAVSMSVPDGESYTIDIEAGRIEVVHRTTSC